MVPIEHVYEQIRTFAADAGARKVVLFGSRAKGVNRPKSDIDLAVAGCPDFNRLEQNLQDNLWSLLMLRDRNDSAHIYDEERARRLVDAIIVDYIPEFERVNQGLVVRYGEALND